jgi:hypothetical protein
MSYAIFQEQKIQEFSHNAYNDVGVFWPSYSPDSHTYYRSLLYVGRILLLN